jgi:large subunit ribosomal protein L3
MKFLLGKKLGMTTIHDPEKGARNVTLLECDINRVTLVRTPERDGYSAVQLEMPKTVRKNVRREFRLDTKVSESEVSAILEALPIEATVSVENFSVGERVSVSGISKAKGFQGVVKRHGFKGAPKTHGHKHDLRAPGSIGSTFPQHVIKGMRMAGRMGGVRATTKNLSISYIDPKRKLIGVRGAVPGIVGSVVEIRSTK